MREAERRATELDRIDAQLVEYNRENVRWQQGATLLEEGGLLFTIGSVTFPGFVNGLIRLDPHLAADTVIERGREVFEARGRGFTLFVRGERDRDLETAGLAQGLLPTGEGAPWMVLRAPPEARPWPDDLRVARVRDAVGLDGARRVNREAFAHTGLPPEVTDTLFANTEALLAPHLAWFVAWRGDEPVSTAMTHLHGDVAGIHWVGTRDSARGHGLGDRVTRVATRWGFEQGATCATLQASDQGFPIYEAMGFETVSFQRLLIALPGGALEALRR